MGQNSPQSTPIPYRNASCVPTSNPAPIFANLQRYNSRDLHFPPQHDFSPHSILPWTLSIPLKSLFPCQNPSSISHSIPFWSLSLSTSPISTCHQFTLSSISLLSLYFLSIFLASYHILCSPHSFLSSFFVLFFFVLALKGASLPFPYFSFLSLFP